MWPNALRKAANRSLKDGLLQADMPCLAIRPIPNKVKPGQTKDIFKFNIKILLPWVDLI